MSETCDTRYWVLATQAGWAMVVLTTNDRIEADVAAGYYGGETIDRHEDPVPYERPVL